MKKLILLAGCLLLSQAAMAESPGGFFFYGQTESPAKAAPAPTQGGVRVNNVTVVASEEGLGGSTPLRKPNPMAGYSLAELSQKLRVGDMILRQGVSWESRMIRQIDGSNYSHIAYVTQTNPEVWVVHAATDEVPGKKYQVVKEKLTGFLSAKNAEGYAAYRPDFMSVSDRELAASELEKMQGQPFILASQNQPHRYCTTIIRQVIHKRYPSYNPAWKNISYKNQQGTYLTPSAMITRGMSLIMSR